MSKRIQLAKLWSGKPYSPEAVAKDIPEMVQILKVDLQIAVLRNRALCALRDAEKMRKCKHKKTGMRMHNGLPPKSKKKCLDCEAWLE